MLKIIGFLFSVLLICGNSSATERDFLHGEVLEVNIHDLVLTIEVEPLRGADHSRVVTVLMSEGMLLDSGSGKQRLPGCVHPGNHVRIWGAVAETDTSRFMADEIRGCGMVACNDPTGVRSRLSRHRKGDTMGGMCR